jgi:hypothetical protein
MTAIVVWALVVLVASAFFALAGWPFLATLFLFFGWSAINVAIANDKGRSPVGWIFFSLILSPLLTILLLCLPRRQPGQPRAGALDVATITVIP